MRVITLEQIRAALPSIDLIGEIEAGFVAYSSGRSVVPPVGELVMRDPPGEVHIKYGCIEGDDHYVIKIASGFSGNADLGLPTSNGMMLVFSRQNGRPEAVLLDEGYLTDVRTAAAGAIAAKHLAPSKVGRIGIVGTGMQARLQLEHLRPVTDCRDVLAWGRDPAKLAAFADDMATQGFRVETTDDPDRILAGCNLIVTTTAATAPILRGRARPGTHITAVGSDTHDKQELEATILGAADLVVADSIAQNVERGEIHQALDAGAIDADKLVELGAIIAGTAPGRTTDEQVSVADLTGVAVQDIRIATAVLETLGAEAGR